ncbi:MAG: hypothetical protein U0892_17710 [Pirellulales bacterium]
MKWGVAEGCAPARREERIRVERNDEVVLAGAAERILEAIDVAQDRTCSVAGLRPAARREERIHASVTTKSYGWCSENGFPKRWT